MLFFLLWFPYFSNLALPAELLLKFCYCLPVSGIPLVQILKVWSSHSNLGVTRHIPSGIINWDLANFYFILMIQSHVRSIKPIYSGLRISGMTMSNQSELPTFFSARQVNLKISHRIFINPTIPEDDFPNFQE
jgi:hypothetical protein